MSQKIDKIGKASALISSLVLMALMLNLWIIDAIASDQAGPPQKVHQRAEKVRKPLMDRVYQIFAPNLQAGESVPITEAQFESSVFALTGRPVAYVLHNELYLVNRHGKILGSSDSVQHVDVPIISGSSAQIDQEHQILTDEFTKRALSFVVEMEKFRNLHALVSEIKVLEENLVAYMNFGDVVPVIFGQDNWNEKIGNLESYYKQLGATDLNRQAAYLDLRFKDRVVVKKSV